MGDMMYPRRRRAQRLGDPIGSALPKLVAPEDAVDLGPVVLLERSGFFDSLMGATNAAGQSAA